jgi:transcriptional regulator with XRE-family HTH domain
MELTAFDKIRLIRQQKGFSQEIMASQLGIMQSAYHKIECGKSKLKFEQALHICEILEIPISEIIPSGKSLPAGRPPDVSREQQLKGAIESLEREIQYLKGIIDCR